MLHNIELRIDEDDPRDVTSFFSYDRDSYSEGKLEYNLPQLEAGYHRVTLRVWDNLNNSSQTETEFRLVQSNDLVRESVYNYPNPFSTTTEFTFQSVGAEGGEILIKIYTISGRLIRTIEGNAVGSDGFNHVYWDGLDDDGDRLANGVYLYKIKIQKGERSKEVLQKLVVLR